MVILEAGGTCMDNRWSRLIKGHQDMVRQEQEILVFRFTVG